MRFSQKILRWFDHSGRKHLPWQQNRTAYRVWVSEIMLQQTQVATVIPYFERFMQRFPAIIDLAAAAQDEVLELWTGLGYYARGRNLHKCAQVLVDQYQGEFPNTVAELETLPGIGRSTAGAIISLALDQPATILDGNVKRVLARFHGIAGWPGQTKIADQLWQYAEQHSPRRRCADYTQAMMDLGATLCTRSKPLCRQCPLQADCLAFQQGRPEAYPAKKPKKILPVKTTQLLILRNPNNDILLEQRPPIGIWGGLWSFPELPVDVNPLDHCEAHYGAVADRQHWPTFRHSFSHYHLEIQPVQLQLKTVMRTLRSDNQQRWYAAHEWPQLGMAAPIKKLLQSLGDTQLA
jgi:A/G-specific adenine glycosylase